MRSIVLIVPYIGKWPVWFEAHLVSISRNQKVHWLFITDCEIPVNYPENVRFITSTLEDLNERINHILQVTVPLSPRKLCDIRPAYGVVFQEYIKDYDFWGFCDIDIIWGDIRKFITEDILEEYAIISSRKRAISGHFTLLRNTDDINTLYQKIPFYSDLLIEEEFMWVDEEVFTDFLAELARNDANFKVYWSSYLMYQKNGVAYQEYYLDKWIWKDGEMVELKNGKPINEVMYLHFINWKRTMKYNEVQYDDSPKKFYISYNGMHYNKHLKIKIAFNLLKNIFNGFWVKERRRVRNIKLKRLKRRLNNKMYKILTWK